MFPRKAVASVGTTGTDGSPVVPGRGGTDTGRDVNAPPVGRGTGTLTGTEGRVGAGRLGTGRLGIGTPGTGALGSGIGIETGTLGRLGIGTPGTGTLDGGTGTETGTGTPGTGTLGSGTGTETGRLGRFAGDAEAVTARDTTGRKLQGCMAIAGSLGSM